MGDGTAGSDGSRSALTAAGLTGQRAAIAVCEDIQAIIFEVGDGRFANGHKVETLCGHGAACQLGKRCTHRRGCTGDIDTFVAV